MPLRPRRPPSVITSIVLPAPLAPRAIALTMGVLHLDPIKHVRIASVHGARRRSGALCALALTLLASHERQCAFSLGGLARQAALARVG